MSIGGRINVVYHDRKVKIIPVTEDELNSPIKFMWGFLCGAVTVIVAVLIGWAL